MGRLFQEEGGSGGGRGDGEARGQEACGATYGLGDCTAFYFIVHNFAYNRFG